MTTAIYQYKENNVREATKKGNGAWAVSCSLNDPAQVEHVSGIFFNYYSFSLPTNGPAQQTLKSPWVRKIST